MGSGLGVGFEWTRVGSGLGLGLGLGWDTGWSRMVQGFSRRVNELLRVALG